MVAKGIKSHVGNLVLWSHRASKQPKARVIVVHGMSEHSGRHLNTVGYLVSEGYEVVRFDLRGAGESGGERQFIDTFEDYVADLVKVYHWVCEREKNLPLFVVGHSLGGTIALQFAARYGREIVGLALSAPAFQVGEAISPVKIRVGKILARWVPTMRLAKSTDSKAISRDPKILTDYQLDPLACHFNTLNQGAEIIKTLSTVLDRAREIACPTIIFHGSHDRIIKLEGSFEILKHLKVSPDKILYVLPGVFHEPHNDLDKERYFELLGGWFRSRLRNQSLTP